MAGCVAIVVAMPFLMIYSTVIGAFAVMKLWAWFVVPTFGMSALSLPVAAGLRLVLEAFNGYRIQPDKKSDDELGPSGRLAVPVISQTAHAVFVLAAGWIIKTWWMA